MVKWVKTKLLETFLGMARQNVKVFCWKFFFGCFLGYFEGFSLIGKYDFWIEVSWLLNQEFWVIRQKYKVTLVVY